MEDADSFILARWILPVSQAPMENACLVTKGTRVHSLLSKQEYESLPEKTRAGRSRDLGEAVIVPGLMNLHTHLDYSGLKHFDNYSPFFGWIKGLIARSWSWTPEQWFESALSGAGESLLSGSTFVVDSSYSGAAARAVAKTGLRGLVGLELFGIEEEESEQVFAEWLKKYEQFMSESGSNPELKEALESGRLKITIAPHTPYSVCPALLRKALSWSKENNLPLLIHIAESEAECRWIAASDVELNSFLQEAFRRELPPLEWRGQGLSPVQHMEKHGLLDEHVIAAHLVQLSPEDIEILARRKVSAVHCPRSNSRLRNGVAPFSALIKAGIELGFGTDSAASVDDLSVLCEARFAWNLHRAMDTSFSERAEKALYYLTLGSARALGADSELGSLDPGKYCDFSAFDLGHLPESARQNPHECLINGGAVLKEVVVNGRSLVQNGYIKRQESDPDSSTG